MLPAGGHHFALPVPLVQFRRVTRGAPPLAARSAAFRLPARGHRARTARPFHLWLPGTDLA